MPSFSFLNSAFLLGLAAIAVPVIIHLVSRLRYAEMDFSSAQFLEHSSRRTSRKIQLMNVLLLAARIALVAAFTFALARPLLLRTATRTAPGETCTVIVIDNSYSMGYVTRNQTHLDRAKTSARRFIEAMSDRDTATILTMSDRSAFLLEEPVHDHDILLRRIESIPLTNRGTDVLPALLEAYQLLQKVDVPHRQVLLLGDRQRNGWMRADSTHVSLARKLNEMLAALKTGRKTISLHIADCATDGYRNVGISNVDCAGQILAAGVPFDVSCSLLVSGSHPDGYETGLSLHLGDRPVQRAVVALTGARSVGAEFSVSVADSGSHRGYAALPPDDLPIDNRSYFTIPVRERVRVLLIRRASSSHLSSGAALSLSLRSDGGQPGFLELQETDGRAAEATALEDTDVVILADACRNLPMEALAGFVAQGGGLVVFADAGTDWLNENLGDRPELLPGRFQVESPTAGSAGIPILGVDYGHPVLSLFERESGLLGAVQLARCTPLELFSIAAVRGLASDGAGRFLIAERRVGKGRVLAFGFGCGLEWGNLPLTAALVPLLGQAVLYAAGDLGLDVQGHEVGERVQRSFRGEGWRVRIIVPGGEEADVAASQAAGESSFEFENTEVPGLYTIVAESPSGKLTESFIVNLDTTESILEPASTAEIAGLLPQADPRFVLPGEAPRFLTAEREKTPLLGILLLAVLLLIVTEGYLASRVYRGEESAAQPVVT